MFLIGITGSFIPYLILLGVAFLFSMQVTTRPDNGVFNSDGTSVASNHHLLIPATSLTLSHADYLSFMTTDNMLQNGPGMVE
ncbi:hypothetical protein [Marinilabilia salmonicolor]|uniref:hypothetical protein n=1 Tax=Marinilabilia salmonicolor TaxID=989 RepID=UPI00046A7A5C|nr:hypothetical protein [Marinilabilia salmonicolor]